MMHGLSVIYDLYVDTSEQDFLKHLITPLSAILSFYIRSHYPRECTRHGPRCPCVSFTRRIETKPLQSLPEDFLYFILNCNLSTYPRSAYFPHLCLPMSVSLLVHTSGGLPFSDSTYKDLTSVLRHVPSYPRPFLSLLLCPTFLLVPSSASSRILSTISKKGLRLFSTNVPKIVPTLYYGKGKYYY